MFQTQIIKKQLHFKQPAGTSRGVYTTRDVWYILLTDTGSRHYGVGECAPLPALSCDDIPSYDEVLATACKNLEKNGEIDREALLPYPSILFGMETALLHFRARSLQFWHTPFSKGKEGIPINGLIWMGNFDEMYRRIGEKMQQGFRCIKLKIGAIDFEKELNFENIQEFRTYLYELQNPVEDDSGNTDTTEKEPINWIVMSSLIVTTLMLIAILILLIRKWKPRRKKANG